MKPLAATLIISKNLQAAKDPWVPLFEMTVDSSSDPWRFAAYPEDIPWNNETWTAMNAIVENVQEEASPRLGAINVHVANVDQVVSAYVENNQLIGNSVTIYWVDRGHLDIVEDVLSVSYEINDIQAGAESAVFQLGHEDLLSLQWPWRRYVRDYCDFEYRGELCRYPEDEFDAITRQDLKIGGDRLKLGGWEVENTANADAFAIDMTIKDDDDIDIAKRDTLSITCSSGGPHHFYGATRDAPFAFKTFLGDFDFYTYYTGDPTTDSLALWIIQNTADYGDSVALVAKEQLNVDVLYTRETTDGVTAERSELPHLERYWRVTRVGSVITFYSRPTTTDAWASLRSFTRVDLRQHVRVGFAAATEGTAVGTAQTWEYFKANSGGIATCDHSFDGPNGCRTHENTPNFGGCPGIPYGRLYIG